MSAQTIITLSPQLAQPLQQIAQERGQSVEAVVESLIAEYLREQRHTRLLAEMEQFRTQHPHLLAAYRGQFVGMRDGQVLDHDADGGALYTRLRRQYGDTPILIVEVADSPEQEFTVRNPRLETAA